MRFELDISSPNWDENGNRLPPCNDAELVEKHEFYTDWSVQIFSLEHLLEFTKRNGGRIVIEYNEKSKMPYLEIYNDYRE